MPLALTAEARDRRKASWSHSVRSDSNSSLIVLPLQRLQVGGRPSQRVLRWLAIHDSLPKRHEHGPLHSRVRPVLVGNWLGRASFEPRRGH
jgi:hypothetical protein